ncbi:hypothetical protein PVAP13_9NG599114 [Panicum virgatum]|uniref:Uncharacterized protein n=1 Tax=Panicum virgatum TaxID=38727 RepID=A0A8T0MVM6_PANVG|nr:hypothetical protein PVAP13_9NG599114 [Panicum virgatum]
MSRPSNWWASSSSLRTRFSPPPSFPSPQLLSPPPTAIDGKRRSPPPRFFLPFPRASLLPREKPAGPNIAPIAPPACRPPRPRPRYAPHAPLPTPRFLRLSPAQSSPIRAVSVAGRSGVRVRRDRARRGDPEFPTGVVELGPGRWIRNGSRRG